MWNLLSLIVLSQQGVKSYPSSVPSLAVCFQASHRTSLSLRCFDREEPCLCLCSRCLFWAGETLGDFSACFYSRASRKVPAFQGGETPSKPPKFGISLLCLPVTNWRSAANHPECCCRFLPNPLSEWRPLHWPGRVLVSSQLHREVLPSACPTARQGASRATLPARSPAGRALEAIHLHSASL